MRKARAAGDRDLARELQGLRRPTQSAWLVNLLTRHERAPMERLFSLGRELRRAQTGLDGAELRRLSAQRQQMVADLLDSARRRAADADIWPTDAVLSEVEATLRAALVDLAASSTVLSGRLVRPMSHSGFGPMPHVDAAPPLQAPSPPAEAPAEGQTPERAGTRAAEPAAIRDQETGSGWSFWPVEDELGRQRERAATERAARQGTAAAAEAEPATEAQQGIRHAEAELAAAATRHWQSEQDLADAEGAAEAARDRLEWLDSQRMEARRDKVAADRRLADARSAQRAAIRAVSEARRELEAVERGLGFPGEQPPSGEPASEEPP